MSIRNLFLVQAGTKGVRKEKLNKNSISASAKASGAQEQCAHLVLLVHSLSGAGLPRD